MIARIVLALAGALFLAACGKSGSQPEIQARPALWEIRGEHGEQGWLFGTIHQIPPNIAWRSPQLDQAFSDADALVVEIADLGDRAKLNGLFEELAHSPGQPPIEQRIAAAQRPLFARLMRDAGLKSGDFTNVESWAAALTIAQATQPDENRGGIDGALLKMAGTRPVLELEGARKQLGLFDKLPEKEQRDLLAAIIDEVTRPERDRLTALWAKGDMAGMAGETKNGMLADPELREILLIRRNLDWAGQIGAMLRGGRRPFVAAGAAHMAGADGLPALLADRGWTVTRIQ